MYVCGEAINSDSGPVTWALLVHVCHAWHVFPLYLKHMPGLYAWKCTPDLSCAKVYDAASTRLVCCDVADTHFEFEELAYTWNLCLVPCCVLVQSFCVVGLDSVDAGPAKKELRPVNSHPL